MNSVQEIEAAIRNLPSAEFATLRDWVAAYDAEQWDREFEKDVAAGRLDALAEKALDHLRNGRCTDL